MTTDPSPRARPVVISDMTTDPPGKTVVISDMTTDPPGKTCGHLREETETQEDVPWL
jgi:hypothetical protein